MNASRTKPMPRISVVKPGPGLTIDVTWEIGSRSGTAECIDLEPDILTYKIYRSLRGAKGRPVFEDVRVTDGGTRLVWPDGTDMAATSLERLAEESMTNEEFRIFLSANNLSLTAASAQLGISRRQVAYYAKDKEVPRQIALACRGLEASRQA